MTDTMLEKAARALFEREWNGNPPVCEWETVGAKDYWMESARAALEAIREPSEDIVDAGSSEVWDELGCAESGSNRTAAKNAYRAMIDAILSEGQTNG